MSFKGIYTVCLLLLACCLWVSCKKETQLLTSGGELKFSVDTLAFDTVFTATGSFTTAINIYNPQDREIQLSSVRLEKGKVSYFRINVDGFTCDSNRNVNNLRIAAHDSIYVFATVDIDPTNQNTPFIITDKLIATLNGIDFSIPVTAYGQNAHYVVDSVLNGNITWLTDKPYVLVKGVYVNSGATLTLPAGCRIYANADARLAVFGTLIAEGTKTDSIVFQGDRLDRAYFGYLGYPGEWGGLYFSSHSIGNKLNYVKIKNCGNSALGAAAAAIQVNIDSEKVAAQPQLTMKHCVIENSIGYGIVSYSGTIYAENCLVHSCGAYALALVQGGDYHFDNCTFALYSVDHRISHSDYPTAIILNYLRIDNTHYIPGDLDATLRNCIIWGSLDHELVCDKVNDNPATINLQNCLIKADSVAAFVNTQNCIINQDPLFKNTKDWDYHLSANSPAIGKGINLSNIIDDLEGNGRTAIDIGCYKY